MRILKLAATLLLLQAIAASAWGVEITVGNRPVELPMPAGFVQLTPDMAPFYEAMRAYIPPTNERYVTLITEEMARKIRRGEAVEFVRYINVEAEKQVARASLSSADFAEFRSIMRSQIETMFAQAEENIPGLIDRGNEIASDQLGAEIEVEIGQIVPLPVHLDTETAIANTNLMSVATSIDGEQAVAQRVAGTMLALHVMDKMLFLYVYGAESDVEWTRDMAASWAADILAANAPSRDELLASAEPPQAGIDWNRVLERAGIGAGIAVLIGLLSLVFRRRRQE